jgi:type I restriction enzyme S subunit
MVGDWESVPLGQLVEPGRNISYGIVQPGSPTRDGVPIIRVSDVRDGFISTNNPLRVSADIEAPYARTRLRGGELLLTLVGTVGEAAIAPRSLAGWNTARAIAVIPIQKEIGAYWVKIALRSPVVRELINGRLNTTVQATLNLRDVAELPITLPPVRERGAITDIISALDDKIELNRRRTETLEAMARALFRIWFIHFDPVRAKAEGRPTGLPPDVAVLFPDSFGDDGLPSGWQMKALSEIADFLNGLALQKYPSKGGEPSLPVIKIAELRSGPTAKSDRASVNLPPEYHVRDGDHLFSWSGSLTHCRWTHGSGALNQHLFKVTPAGVPDWLVYEAVEYHLPEFQEIASGKAVTMGHIQRHHLEEAMVALPPKPLLKALDTVMASLHERSFSLALQSRTLSTLRDTLLPKLISGELRIADAENRISAA